LASLPWAIVLLDMSEDSMPVRQSFHVIRVMVDP
jgi:hypothetical protein